VEFQWTNHSGIARLNANGSLDLTFNPGSGTCNGFVWCIAIQTDGKVLIGGDFTSVNGTNRNYLARLNADGSLDTSFTPDLISDPGSSPAVGCMAVQGDGKILIGGSFLTSNGYTRHRVARLNTDGSIDLTFNLFLEQIRLPDFLALRFLLWHC